MLTPVSKGKLYSNNSITGVITTNSNNQLLKNFKTYTLIPDNYSVIIKYGIILESFNGILHNIFSNKYKKCVIPPFIDNNTDIDIKIDNEKSQTNTTKQQYFQNFSYTIITDTTELFNFRC